MSGPAFAPPTIPDYEYRSYVSSGGFGDVFVYKDNMNRDVAIKVLHLKGLTEAAKSAFRVEARRMANLRNRFVVTVYNSGIADDGRPFLSMEYCPDSLEEAIRRQQLPVSEAVRYAIQIASAVAAAHAADLFHRDIKPANVLLTHDGVPALTDFGIAGGRDAGSAGARGLSLRYAAPEVIAGESEGQVLADVYSLAATAYALIAGRAPYETSGGDNSEAGLIERTLAGRLTPTGRADVPASLERVLAHGLALDPSARFQTASTFARALQEVELELGFSETVVPLGEGSAPRLRAASSDDADGTRLAAPQRVDPSVPSSSGRTESPAPLRPSTSARTSVRSRQPSASPDRTLVRLGRERQSPVPDEGEDDATTESSNRKLLTIGAAVAVIVVLGGAIAMLGMRGDADDMASEAVTFDLATPPDSGLLFAQPSVPSGLTVVRGEDGVSVRWNPDPSDGASYVVSITEGPERGGSHAVTEPSLVLDDPEPERQVCVRVLAVVGSVSSEPSREECTR